MLRKIVYARFHVERGPVRLIEHPRDSNTAAENGAPLIDFQKLSTFIVPPYELCNRALSVSIDDSCLLGWPVSIEDERYPRNRFTFNLFLVLDHIVQEEDRRAWEKIVQKTAKWFKEVEEDAGELSRLDELGLLDGQSDANQGASRLRAVIEQMYDQLIAYKACCARLSDTHVLNLRLERAKLVAYLPIHAWDVPILVAKLVDSDIRAWDLVLQRIYPHMDGVAHVGKIASLADVDLDQACDCIASLLQAEAVILLDIFHFQALYEPTHKMAWFMNDEDMQRQCSDYVAISTTSQGLSTNTIVDLYLGVQRGVSVADFFLANREAFENADIRRFITFGVIKGFLRRIHKYGHIPQRPETASSYGGIPFRNPYEDAVKKLDNAWKQAALSSGWATPPSDLPQSIKNKAAKSAEEQRREEDIRLKVLLDGQCSFDQICATLCMSERKLSERLGTEDFDGLTILSK